jgi:hypothetical protein
MGRLITLDICLLLIACVSVDLCPRSQRESARARSQWRADGGSFGPATRAAQIDAARNLQAASLTPDEPRGIEHALDVIEDKEIIQRLTAGIAGLRVHLGGLITYSGFAAGPEYYRRLLHEQLTFRASGRIPRTNSI